MDEAVSQLAADSGALRTVRGEREPTGRYRSLDLSFERGTLHLSCNDDTDELIAAISEPAAQHGASDSSFANVVGMVIDSAWTLINHRGYADAFQIRFLEPTSRVEIARQFEVSASAIDVREVR